MAVMRERSHGGRSAVRVSVPSGSSSASSRLSVVYLAVVPVGFLLWRTFFEDGSFTLDAFRSAYDVFGLSEMVVNSLIFAVASTAIATAIGTALAYVVVRTDAPWKPFLFAAALIPIATPGVLYVVAWVFLASPRTGILNQVLEPVFGPGALNIFGMGGMIFVESLRLAPMCFLLMYAGFRSLDPSLEESALASGARPRTVFLRVALPLVRPALIATVLIAVVRAISSFEIPAVLGIPGGVWVFTSRLWRAATDLPVNLAEAGAYGTPAPRPHVGRHRPLHAPDEAGSTVRDDDGQGLPAAADAARPLARTGHRVSSSSTSRCRSCCRCSRSSSSRRSPTTRRSPVTASRGRASATTRTF